MKEVILLLICITASSLIYAQPPPIQVFPGENQISEAMMYVYPGDILELAEGEYTETQTLTITVDLTIRGTEGARVKWFVPDEVEDAVHVKANFHVENIIFETDSAKNCIVNYNGSIEPDAERDAEKNSIFINNCQFRKFRQYSICTTSTENTDMHPLDTLYVTNCLFYGGPLVDTDPPIVEYGYPRPGWDAGSRGINMPERQVRVAIIKNCTFWRFEDESCKIQGWESTDGSIDVTYLKLLVDHVTTFDVHRIGVYFKYIDADDTIRNSIFGIGGGFSIKPEPEGFTGYVIEYNLADYHIGTNCGVCQPYHYNLITGKNCNTGDPMFKDPWKGDFSLMQGSPAIGAATDGSDLGNPRMDWTEVVTDVEKSHIVVTPAMFSLHQNYPNPFNPTTTISYSVPRSDFVTLKIYNASGKKVRSLVSEIKGIGSYSVVWEGVDDQGQCVPSGVYFYKLKSGEMVETKKMLFLR